MEKYMSWNENHRLSGWILRRRRRAAYCARQEYQHDRHHCSLHDAHIVRLFRRSYERRAYRIFHFMPVLIRQQQGPHFCSWSVDRNHEMDRDTCQSRGDHLRSLWRDTVERANAKRTYLRIPQLQFGMGWGGRVEKVVMIFQDRDKLRDLADGKGHAEVEAKAAAKVSNVGVAGSGTSSDLLRNGYSAYVPTDTGISGTATIA